MRNKIVLSVLLTALLLHLHCATSMMKRNQIEKSDSSALEKEKKILVTTKYNKTYVVTDFTFTDTQLIGTLIIYPPIKYEIWWGYVLGQKKQPISIPLNEIKKIEAEHYDTGKTIKVMLLAWAAAIAVVLLWALAINDILEGN